MGEKLNPRVRIHPCGTARRRAARWRGLAAEVVEFTASGPFEYHFCAPCHLLVASDRGIRSRGETRVEGHITSARRDIARTLSFIPRGHVFRGSFVPRVPPRGGFLYIDPATPLADPGIHFADIEFEPRLFFSDPALWTTARKILRLIEDGDDGSRLYAETLAAALSIELVRFRDKGGLRPPLERGGLADWQRRIASDFINDNFDRDISLEELASLVRLSPTHFCRAFMRSIGMPPHQYQIRQRVERAKILLADSERSITDVAFSTGYSASSNFATAFRRVTGVSPREYRRTLL